MILRIDFHCHTVASDGGLTIPELAALAKRIGLDVLIITDHCSPWGSYFSNLHILETLKKTGYESPVPIIIGSEIKTPFGEFLLFGKRAIRNWYGLKDKLRSINGLLGRTSYWEMFWKHVLHGGNHTAGGLDDWGEVLRDFTPKAELPYAMIMCHPYGSAERYDKDPDVMYRCLHGFEICNSGEDWRLLHPEVVEVLRRKIPGGRELENSDCHGTELGQGVNEVEIRHWKQLNEGHIIKWLRGYKTTYPSPLV